MQGAGLLRLERRVVRVQDREEKKREWLEMTEGVGWAEILQCAEVQGTEVVAADAIREIALHRNTQYAEENAHRSARSARRNKKLAHLKLLHYREQLRLGTHLPTNQCEAQALRTIWEEELEGEALRKACTEELLRMPYGEDSPRVSSVSPKWRNESLSPKMVSPPHLSW